MKIIQVLDLIRHQTLTLEAPEVELSFGDHVLIKGPRETLLAKISQEVRELPGAKVSEDCQFDRKATETELKKFAELQTGELERLQVMQAAADKLELKMHFFFSKIGWGGKVCSFLFASDNPIDFRDLLKATTKEFPMRIGLYRVDSRTRADLIGDVNATGRWEASSFVFSKQKVTLNAARDQGIMIRDNEKLYDVSGRLRRDLMYEVDLYKKYRKYLPHMRQTVTVGERSGRVMGLDILNQKVKILFPDTDTFELLSVSEVSYPGKQVLEEPELEVDFPTVEWEGAKLPV